MARDGSLLAYVLARMALAIPMLLILLTAVFIVLRVLPGDPILALWGGHTPPQPAIDAARQQLGLDQPIPVQYVTYLRNIFTGNFGLSIGETYRGQSVWTQISTRFPATLEIAIGGMAVASLVGIPLGVLGGSNRDKPIDLAVRMFGTIIWVIPIFWLGLCSNSCSVCGSSGFLQTAAGRAPTHLARFPRRAQFAPGCTRWTASSKATSVTS